MGWHSRVTPPPANHEDTGQQGPCHVQDAPRHDPVHRSPNVHLVPRPWRECRSSRRGSRHGAGLRLEGRAKGMPLAQWGTGPCLGPRSPDQEEGRSALQPTRPGKRPSPSTSDSLMDPPRAGTVSPRARPRRHSAIGGRGRIFWRMSWVTGPGTSPRSMRRATSKGCFPWLKSGASSQDTFSSPSHS